MHPLAWGLYTGEYIFLSIPSCLATSSNSAFLNSVPLSDRIFLLFPNVKATWVSYLSTISPVDLVFSGIQNMNRTEQNIMAAGGSGKSSNQVHGDELHGHTSRSEIVLDVLSFIHFLLGAYLAVFAVHEHVFLHSFPVQLLEHCINSSKSVVASMVMCKEKGHADQTIGKYYWFKILWIVWNPSLQ